jgi:[protein-PII] uridylyltransferase
MGRARPSRALLQPLGTSGSPSAARARARRARRAGRPRPENAEFLLALLDVRFIAGDERLFQRLEGWVRGLGPDNRRRLLDALLQLVDERHAPFNETVYQLEPDIKSAPGVLRDIEVARHIRLLRPAARTRSSIAARLDEAEDFSRGSARSSLESHRDVNVLTHELQEKVAEMFGCEGGSQQRVEALMGNTSGTRSLARARPRRRAAARRAG